MSTPSSAGAFLKKFSNFSINQTRNYIRNIPKFKGGIKYPGFTYYPRTPDFKDPPYEPSKLFLIRRLTRLKGLNPVERKTLEILNIDGQISYKKHIAIVKNIPEVNAMLWKVKHLIEIIPIRCPNGIPKDGDYSGTYLKSDGTFLVTEKLKINPEKIKLFEEMNNSKNKFSRAYWTNYLMLKWQNGYDGDI